MYYLKKVFCFVLCIVFVASFPVNAFASEAPSANEDTRRNEFVFERPMSRMDSNGNYHVSVVNYKQSDYFTSTSTSLTVSASAWLRDTSRYHDYYDPSWPFSPPTDSSKYMTITLYKWVNHHATEIDSFNVYCTDRTVSHTFSNIESNVQYYLYFSTTSDL